MRKLTTKKLILNGLLILAVGIFVYWDLHKSLKASVAEGTFRPESEFGPPSSAITKVAIVPSDYSELNNPVSRGTDPSIEQIEDMVRKAIELQGGLDWVVNPGDQVMIKPNIVEKNTPPGLGTNTDVRVVKALIKIIDEHTGGDVEIIVAEGIPRPDYDDPTSTHSSWEHSGYRDLLSDSYLSRINFSLFNLNQPYSDLVKVDLGSDGTAAPHDYEYYVHEKELEVDVFITVPVLKIHNTGITNALKNQIGTAPGAYYGYNKTKGSAYYGGLVHDVAQRRWTTEEIVDLSNIAGIDFVVVDAIMCLETYKTYSSSADQVRMNTIIAGTDPVAVDHVCSKLVGLNPDDIAHITLAEKVGLGTNNPDKIEIVGASISQVKKLFEKNPDDNGRFGQSNRTWLLSQLFYGTNINTEHIANESTLEPVAGENGWSQPIYFFDDRIDLLSYYSNPSGVITYAFTYFTAPEDQNAELWIGYDEPVWVYINGSKVFSYGSTTTYNDYELEKETKTISIKKGINTLLVKTVQQYGDYSFVLNICEPGTNGNRVDGLKFHTDKDYSAIPDNLAENAGSINIAPNPFRDFTNISFELRKTGNVRMDVFNIQGQRIATLIDQEYSQGEHTVTWNLKSNRGQSHKNGVYIININTGNQKLAKPVVIRK